MPDYGTTDVADHAIGLMLSITRGIVQVHNSLASDPVGNWSTINIPQMRRVRGATFELLVAAGLAQQQGCEQGLWV